MKDPVQFPYNHLEILGIKKLKKYIPLTKEWCLNAAKLEENMEVGIGGGVKIEFSPEDLAPLVEKIAEKMAEDINKSGLKEQLKFLEQNGWDGAAVCKYLLEDME